MKPLSALLALLLLFSCAMASSPVELTVTVSAVLVSNDHVGNDWTISHTINGVEYFSEDLASGFTIEVPVTVTETGGRYSSKTASWVITYHFAT